MPGQGGQFLLALNGGVCAKLANATSDSGQVQSLAATTELRPPMVERWRPWINWASLQEERRHDDEDVLLILAE